VQAVTGHQVPTYYVRGVHCLPNFAKRFVRTIFSAPAKWLYVSRKLLGQCRCVYRNHNESLSGNTVARVVIRNEKRVAGKPFSSDCCYRLPHIAVQKQFQKSRENIRMRRRRYCFIVTADRPRFGDRSIKKTEKYLPTHIYIYNRSTEFFCRRNRFKYA